MVHTYMQLYNYNIYDQRESNSLNNLKIIFSKIRWKLNLFVYIFNYVIKRTFILKRCDNIVLLCNFFYIYLVTMNIKTQLYEDHQTQKIIFIALMALINR